MIRPLYVQEIHNSEDGENTTVFNDLDIVEHKIEIYTIKPLLVYKDLYFLLLGFILRIYIFIKSSNLIEAFLLT